VAGSGTFGINTYSYTLTHTAAHCLERLAERGHAVFELMIYPGHAWPPDMGAGERRALARLLADRGLSIRTLNMPNIDVNVAAAAPEMRALSRAHLGRVIGLAGDLGVPGVIIGPGKPNPLLPAPKEQLMGWFREALDQLLPLAETAGTRLLVENMPFAFLPDADSLIEALDGYGSDEVGVVYDVANAVFAREDPGAGLSRVRPRLALVHLSDTGLDAYRHDPVGAGVVPFDEVGRHLAEIGYDGVAMLEIISPAPDADIPASIERLLALPSWRQLIE
jgi:sugar phosphate isomerase/epimerase